MRRKAYRKPHHRLFRLLSATSCGSLPEHNGKTSTVKLCELVSRTIADRRRAFLRVSFWSHNPASSRVERLQLPQQRLRDFHGELDTIFPVFPIQDVAARFDHRQHFSVALWHADLDALHGIGCKRSVKSLEQRFQP